MTLSLLIDKENNRYSFVQHQENDLKFQINLRRAQSEIIGLIEEEIDDFKNEKEANSANQEQFIQRHRKLQGMTLDTNLTIKFLNVREI